jgi:GNAT superfamily N-acetyltransferase
LKRKSSKRVHLANPNGEDDMTEFKIVAIAPHYSGRGLGKIMFNESLQAVKVKNLLGRCGVGFEGAAHILRKLGFVYLGTGPEGTQFLVEKRMPVEFQ